MFEIAALKKIKRYYKITNTYNYKVLFKNISNFYFTEIFVNIQNNDKILLKN